MVIGSWSWEGNGHESDRVSLFTLEVAGESSGLARLHWIGQGACFGISPFSSTKCEYIYSSELSFMTLSM